MNSGVSTPFEFQRNSFHLFASGALYWPAERLLCVSDLHLGKSTRYAKSGGASLPPYEVQETLSRIEEAIEATQPDTVVCLGDSFDAVDSQDDILESDYLRLTAMMAGRSWIWIEGNHDPGPVGLGGQHLKSLNVRGITFRHIAETTDTPEISGHYHPKARIRTRARGLSFRALLIDHKRIIMPAFGTYTGGLWSDHQVFSALMDDSAQAYLLRQPPLKIPMPR